MISKSQILFIVSAVQFLTPFMMSATGVALPAIGREFSATAVQLGLVETVYIFAVTLLLLPCGRWGDIHGRKKTFITGTIIFTISTIFLSTAWSIESFIVFRFLQGSGAAMITGTSVAILSAVFPPAKRGKAMGIIVSCVYAGLSAGPLLAGLMITHLGWRWIFYASVPVELAALFLTVFKMKGEWAEARGELFDWQGSLIYIVSMFGLITGVSNLVQTDWALWVLTGGILGLTGFVVFEYKNRSPILNIRLVISNRVFAFSNMATLINYAASFGLTFFFSLYLQIVKGLTPQTTGFILIIQPVIQALFSPYFGKMSDRYSPAVIATIGMAICAGGLGTGTTLDTSSSLWVVVLILIIMGTGFAMFSSPNMTAVMGCVEPRFYGVASSLIATMRSTGIMTSMTIITIIFSLVMGQHQVTAETTHLFIKSMSYAMYIFCLLSFIGICFSAVRTQNIGGQLSG